MRETVAGRSKKNDLLGIISVLGALYLVVCFAGYSRWDPSPFTRSTFGVHNYGGITGSYLSDILFTSIGVSAFAAPVFLFLYGIRRFMGSPKMKIHLAGAALFLLSFSVLLALPGYLFIMTGSGLGGDLGFFGARALRGFLSTAGSYIFAVMLLLSSLVLLSPVSVFELVCLARSPGAKTKEKNNEESEEEEPGDLFAGAGEPLYVNGTEDVLPAAAKSPIIEDEEDVEEDYTSRPAPAGEYALPPIELLSEQAGGVERPTREEILAGSALLEKKLRDFGIQGKVAQVHAGPIVTMYEFEPAAGIKIQKVVSLSEDLSLAMKAVSVRIAPIPGKAAIGIEIPNRLRETVMLREIISSEGFRKSASRLTIALGKDIFGTPVVADLARMPHLLMAGATGAGKSMCLNSIVTSLLYKSSPEELRMLMIDPKLLELSAFEGIPHLISPVITAPKAASEALKKMVFEMERRYRLIAQTGAKSMDGFNRMAPERLPYIVVVIDELADLMLSSAAEVEDSIGRLAQMARASGIHLIVATQRPSVDVLTGVIKANFPTRVSFQMASRIDSRTIIDSQGAEQLIGKGDMLFCSPGTRITRVHGAYISEQEIKAVADFARAQGSPDYDIFNSIKDPAPEETAPVAGERDMLYEKALDMAAAAGEVSISSLQRRLKVGFNRAARIMELMEEDGLVGPPRGAGKPRAFTGRRHF